MNVLFAGGGTGGHLYPAIAVADALRERGDGVAFVGTADRLEATIVPKAGYPLYAISGRPLVRRLSLETLRTAGANALGTVQSVALLARLRPDVVIATGGYVCFPLVLAARMLRWTRIAHAAIALVEPNATPGLTNRLLAPLVDEVWGAFPEGSPQFAGKYRHTGIPVRAALRALPPRDEAAARLGLDRNAKTLLAMGGSQGARTVNDALLALLKSDGLPAGWQLACITGERDFDRMRTISRNGVAVRSYLDDMTDAYAAADLVLARAGASTLGELASAGKPAILVPYPFAADDHQAANANSFVATGAGIAMADADLTRGRLPAVLAQAVEPARLAAMQAAAQRLSGKNPVTAIIARVDWLAGRKKQP